MSLQVDLRVADQAWHAVADLEAVSTRALQAAYKDNTSPGFVDVLLGDDAALEALNTAWRGKPQPTDVLSFPAGDNPEKFLGDIAVAYGVAARDAAKDGKSLEAHLSHLLIHGLLHLLGHDHIEDDDAEIMEALERAALADLGIDDPYSRIAKS